MLKNQQVRVREVCIKVRDFKLSSTTFKALFSVKGDTGSLNIFSFTYLGFIEILKVL